MTDWTAVTESGTVYQEKHGRLYRNDYCSGTIYSLRAVPADIPENMDATFWDWLKQFDEVDTPIEGERIYAVTRDEWYVGAPVVSVTVEQET